MRAKPLHRRAHTDAYTIHYADACAIYQAQGELSVSCSLAQVSQMNCPACSVEFVTELWIIVDTAEKNNLYEALTNDTIHDVTCPHCGYIGRVDAPLLVCHTVQPTVDRMNRFGPIYTKPVRRLFYFPPLNPTGISDEVMAVSLLSVLRERLGDDWKPLAQTKLLSLPRPLLAAAIADDAEAGQARIRGKVAVQLALVQGDKGHRRKRKKEVTH